MYESGMRFSPREAAAGRCGRLGRAALVPFAMLALASGGLARAAPRPARF